MLEVSTADLTKLQTWFSPSFPVGAFSYSHGLEWLVETGEVRDVSSLRGWIEGVLLHGSGRSDAILLCAAWRAAAAQQWSELQEIAALAAALQPTAERRIESLGQGTAFCAAVTAAWPHPLLDHFRQTSPREIAAPVAVGVAGAAHQLPLDALLVAFLQAFAANLVSAGVRLIPLGQSDGLKVTSMLEPVVDEVSRQALADGLDDVGSAAILTDIASMRHELQYTRLFRS
ncbi:urease accessory protein UreF [Pseudaminobacter arsenicus]|uniref:Urease accessory protein UreF n=1 Tax=Borborobacter arsenicus TaxID=1851146 RepID=A0A432V7N8_9HYPH|nr:urease accessory protein UreF [Pseudaminobacter arsenicus]RUM98191.1 urease accessory protein UreF [Pseudaminobacter arsenicus]